MSDPEDPLDPQVEAAATAWRGRDASGIRSHHAWHDLDETGRLQAFEVILRNRQIEAALDPDGLSTTARAVLARIPRTPAR